MRRNRKKQEKSSSVLSYVAGLVVIVVVMMLVYFGIYTKCAALNSEYGHNEKRIATLRTELKREEMLWSKKNSCEALEEALLQHGLVMEPAKPEQIVRMDLYGRMIADQASVRRFRASGRVESTAMLRQP